MRERERESGQHPRFANTKREIDDDDDDDDDDR
jgi:hypothetical protein